MYVHTKVLLNYFFTPLKIINADLFFFEIRFVLNWSTPPFLDPKDFSSRGLTSGKGFTGLPPCIGVWLAMATLSDRNSELMNDKRYMFRFACKKKLARFLSRVADDAFDRMSQRAKRQTNYKQLPEVERNELRQKLSTIRKERREGNNRRVVFMGALAQCEATRRYQRKSCSNTWQ